MSTPNTPGGPGALGPFRTSEVHVPDPYPLYRRYREADPVHRAEDGSWYLFRHDDVARVLTGRGFGRGALPSRLPADCPHLRRTTAHWMVFMDPPEHTRVRALVSRSFTPRVVESLRPRIRQLTAGLVDGLAADLAGGRAADLVDRFAAPLPILVISELLGVPKEDRPWFRGRAVDLQQATSSRVARAADGFTVAEAAARELDTYFRTELARRRAAGTHTHDLIGGMLRDTEGRQDDDTLVGTCIHRRRGRACRPSDSGS
ncbi:hypothetical protein AB0K09_32665 [Streptomyces sp. NPDC049577]|uniref:hypothetical protein n=1 Tax=Streptomyces sp. NPDC049577 TaxID=3155153 RepID=UPI00342B3C81